MFRVILLIFAIIEFSASVTVEDASINTMELSETVSRDSDSTFVSFGQDNGIVDIDKKTNKNNPSELSEQYFFISDTSGKVIITNATSYEIITSYDLPEISKSLLAIVGDTFYNIDTLGGVILSTSISNIMSGPSSIAWDRVGLFDNKKDYVRNGVVVNGTLIYFVANGGAVYLFDTNKKTVTDIGGVCEYSHYGSLVIMDNILFIHKCSYLFSYDGNTIKGVITPEPRYDAGLFRFQDSICRVGGNKTDEFPDPVRCLKIKGANVWETMSYINEARKEPSVVTAGSKIYIFGGEADFNSGNPPNFWRTSVEVFDSETKTWSYIPSPFNTSPERPQAIFFSL